MATKTDTAPADTASEVKDQSTPAADPWIATSNIYLGTALGYVVGDEVSDQVVTDHDLKASVSRKSSDKAARALAGELDAQGLPVPTA